MKIYTKYRQQIVSWLARLLTLGLQVVIMRFLSSFWDTDTFGHYLYLVALISMGTLFDMGLALAVQNRLSQLKARCQSTVEVYASLLPVCALLGVGFFGVGSFFLAVLEYFGVLSLPVPYALLGVSILFGLSYVLLRTIYAEGHGEHTYYAQSAFLTLFLGLLAGYFYLFSSARAPSPVTLAFVYYTLFIGSHLVVGFWKGGGRALFSQFSPSQGKALVRQALGFWAYAGIGFFITQTDLIILGSLGAFTSLTYYTVVSKVFFGGCYTFLYVILSLVHPKITMSWELGEYSCAFAHLKRMVLTGLAMALGFTLLFEMTKGWLVGVLISHPERSILQEPWVYGFYLFFIARILSDACQTFLMALSEVKVINIITLIQAVVGVALQVILASRWGIEGVVIGLGGSYLFSALSFAWVLARRRKLVIDLREGIRAA